MTMAFGRLSARLLQIGIPAGTESVSAVASRARLPMEAMLRA